MSNPSRSVARERSLALATLLLVSLIASSLLWGPGLLNTRGGGDSPFLLLRTHQLAVNLRAGVFPARWMPDAAYGFGYPFFSYYAALPYYLAAGFTLTGLDILTAIKLTQTLFCAAAAVAMYLWAERILRSRPGAWLAAVAYTVAPFHLVNVYVRGDSLSEFAAFAFYPLILWGVDRLARRPTVRRALAPALGYGGLIVTHNVSALIFSPFLLFYVALHILRFLTRESTNSIRGKVLHSGLLILPLLVGLLLSAWFWLPALGETESVQLDVQTTGYFSFLNHFRGVDLIQWRAVFEYATGRPEGSPFAMGLLQASLASAGVVVVAVTCARQTGRPHRKQAPHQSTTPDEAGVQPCLWSLSFGVVGLCLSTWLITPLSRPLWDHLPLLPMVQFPWRFLSVQALFTALLTGSVVSSRLPSRWSPSRIWLAAVLIGGLLAGTTLLGLEPEYLPINADEVTVERLQLYELFTGNIGSTIRHEYLPRWVKPRPHTGPDLFDPSAPPQAFPVDGEILRATRLDQQPTRQVWEIRVGEGGSAVAFPLYYWPGWRASVDGTPVAVEPAPGSGYLSVPIPAGAHTVEMWLGRTPLRLWCEVASLVTAVAVVAVGMIAPWRKRGEGKPEDGRAESAIGNWLRIAPWVPFVALLTLLIMLQPRVVATGDRDLTMDFEEMPYLHHNPTGVASSGWRLTGYDYDSETVQPGESLRITLDWETENGPAAPGGDGTFNLRLVSPATVRDSAVPPVAETALVFSEHDGGEGRTTVDLSVPHRTGPGLYLPRTGSEPPITLRPVWVTAHNRTSEEPVVATFAEKTVRLHEIEAKQTAPEELNVALQWSAARPIAANYGLGLSLTDVAGREWLRQGDRPGYDTQPGRGFLPTSLWPVDRAIHDQHVVALAPGTPPGDHYVLTVDLYRVATWESVGQVTTTVALTQATRRPDAPLLARLGEEIALSHLEVPESVLQGGTAEATAYWMALESPSKDYRVEWRLKSREENIVLTQALAPGSSSVDWPAGAWVAGRTALSIPPTAPAGDYTMSLAVLDPASDALVGSYTHPVPITIEERSRTWEVPSMDREVGASFGGMIELAGYDFRQGQKALQLTLHWQALEAPDRHYSFFVHLADPASGHPLRQVDSMPKGFTYPTGIWVEGEVVSDQVVIPLEEMPEGEYELVVGWYDPDTKVRLQAVDRHGEPVPDDRLVLPDRISLP